MRQKQKQLRKARAALQYITTMVASSCLMAAAPSSLRAAPPSLATRQASPRLAGALRPRPLRLANKPAVASREAKLVCSAAADAQQQEAGSTPAKLKWWEKDMHENMIDIHGTDQFLEVMGNSGDQLVIVDFYATWCHACRGLYPKLAKMMAENPDIKLLKVEFESNRDLCKSLGVKVLPFFHFYRGNEGRLAAFSASLKKIDRLKEAIEEHNAPRCTIGDTVVYKDIQEVAESGEV